MQQGERLAAVAATVARRHAYLTTKEAGRVLGLPASKVAELVREGSLPARRVTPAFGTVGRELRIAAADLVTYGHAGAAS
jgi:excisionase family DNA binding protein